MNVRFLAFAVVTAVGAGSAVTWQNVVHGSPVTEVKVLGQRAAPLRITSAEVVGAGTIRVRVENGSSEPVHSVAVTAFVVRPDGYLSGSQVQPLNPLDGRLEPAGSAAGTVSLDGFQLAQGSKVLLAIHRAVTATGTWELPKAAIDALVSAVPITASFAGLAFELQEATGVTLQQGCGQWWCESERKGCISMCGGAKGVQSFTCHAQTCYSQCVCQW